MTAFKFVALAAALTLAPVPSATAADLGAPRAGANANAGGSDRRAALWQGFYAGVTVGASSSVVDVMKVGTDDDLQGSSASVGALAGYNLTMGPWLLGVEADVASGGFDGKRKKRIAGLGEVSADDGAVGSLRLRGGYIWNDVLFYGTAGLALTDAEIKSSLGGKAEMRTGLALGLGAEWAFDSAWTARVEGMVYAFGEEDVKFGGAKRDVGYGQSALRFGIARRF